VACEGFRGVGDGRADKMRFYLLGSRSVCVDVAVGDLMDLIRNGGFKQP
jgi:hypothetical protein